MRPTVFILIATLASSNVLPASAALRHEPPQQRAQPVRDGAQQRPHLQTVPARQPVLARDERSRASQPRAYVPRRIERPMAPERIAPRRYAPVRIVRPRLGSEPLVRPHAIVPVLHRPAPRAVVIRDVVAPRVVFRRYVSPARTVIVRQPRIIRSYVVTTPAGYSAAPIGYVYSGYAPAYTSYVQYVPAYVPYREVVNDYVPFYGYGGYAPYDPGDAQYAQAGYGSYNAGYNPYAGAGYVAYGNGLGNPFGNQALQGVVIANTGNVVVLMTPSLTPVFVNVAPAEQTGYLQTSNLSPGTFLNVLGYQAGNEFFATAVQ